MPKKLLRSLAPGLLLALLLSTPSACAAGAAQGLRLWAQHVLPVLLPFYTATGLLCQCGGAELLAPLLRPVCRLLRLPDALGGLLLVGWVSGAPNGVRLLAAQTDDPVVCTRFAACAAVTGPMFLIGTIGGLLGSPALGALVYGIHLFTAICSGFLWRGRSHPSARTDAPAPAAFVPLFAALPDALRASCLSLLIIGGSIAFFTALSASLEAIGLTAALETILRSLLPAPAVSPLLSSFLEVSRGSVLLAQSALSLPLRLSLLCAAASFGGVCVLCQAKVFLQHRVRARDYFLQRLTHAALSFLLCRALFLLPGISLPVSCPGASCAPTLSAPPPALVILSLGILLFGACIRPCGSKKGR